MEYVRDEAAPGPPSDQQLVAAARQGDVTALSGLFERHEASVRSYLTGLCGDPELAADVAQEVFIALSGKLHQLRDDDAFLAWLYRSAHHRLRTETRRARYRRVISLDWLMAGRDQHPALADPGDTREAAREGAEIHAALNVLSPRLREALLLSRHQGFSAAEVANILGISPEAAKKRITRACADFRRHYQQERS